MVFDQAPIVLKTQVGAEQLGVCADVEHLKIIRKTLGSAIGTKRTSGAGLAMSVDGGRPEVAGGAEWTRPIVLDRRQPVTFGAPLGVFGISHFLMSAAKPSCSAFLMASDRIDPAGNFLACARASDARAAQS